MSTPTAQDERVEVRALKGEYQFGFHDPFNTALGADFGPRCFLKVALA